VTTLRDNAPHAAKRRSFHGLEHWQCALIEQSPGPIDDSNNGAPFISNRRTNPSHRRNSRGHRPAVDCHSAKGVTLSEVISERLKTCASCYVLWKMEPREKARHGTRRRAINARYGSWYACRSFIEEAFPTLSCSVPIHPTPIPRNDRSDPTGISWILQHRKYVARTGCVWRLHRVLERLHQYDGLAEPIVCHLTVVCAVARPKQRKADN
jgi:hypothetical protein